jgi:hypothetical protein
MNKENLLCFLGVKNENELSKYSMKRALQSDILYSLAIIGAGLYLEYISFSALDIVCSLVILATTIFFIVRYKKANSVVKVISYTTLLLCVTTLKLLYGYWIFANGEKMDYGDPMFSWVHLTALLVALWLAVFLSLAQFKRYKEIMKLPSQELINLTQDNLIISVRNFVNASPWILIPIILFPLPYILSKNLGIGVFDNGGIGVCFWIIFCIWIVLLSFFLLKFIIVAKHKLVL